MDYSACLFFFIYIYSVLFVYYIKIFKNPSIYAAQSISKMLTRFMEHFGCE